MNKRRLLKLADFLETQVPEKRFRMQIWADDGEEEHFPQKWSCQTVGCALGWATSIPAFKRIGLHLNQGGTPTYDGRKAYDAAIAFFDLSYSQSYEIFNPYSYPSLHPSRRTVIRRIRNLVAPPKE